MGDRAESFRAAAVAARPLGPGELVLLEEVCRLIDRSDRFDALISGEASAWAEIEWPFEDAPARLVISSAVSEARQTVAEIRQVVKALGLPVAAAAPKARTGGVLTLLEGAKSAKASGRR